MSILLTKLKYQNGITDDTILIQCTTKANNAKDKDTTITIPTGIRSGLNGALTMTLTNTDSLMNAREKGKGASNKTDQNLVFGLERTFFSIINIDLMLVLFGGGLNMVTLQDDGPKYAGFFFTIMGFLHMTFAVTLHFIRVHKVLNSKPLWRHDTSILAGTLYLFILGSLICEFVYAIKYPYLTRSMPVTLQAPPVNNNSTL